MKITKLKNVTLNNPVGYINPLEQWNITIEYGIDHGYFSITGEAKSTEGHETGGIIHDIIRDAAPWFSPLIDAHLNDAYTGEPLYALENGWFWYQSTRQDNSPTTLPKGWENLNRQQRAAAYLKCGPELFTSVNGSKDKFTEIIASLQPYWQEQARSLRALYKLGEFDV